MITGGLRAHKYSACVPLKAEHPAYDFTERQFAVTHNQDGFTIHYQEKKKPHHKIRS